MTWGIVWVLFGLVLALVNTLIAPGVLDRGWPFLLVAMDTLLLAERRR